MTLLTVAGVSSSPAIAATPTIFVSEAILDFSDTYVGSNSAQQSYQVSGEDLIGNLVVTPPEGFLISLTNGSGYSSSPISIAPSGGIVSPTNIYVVFSPLNDIPYTTDISHTSTGAISQSVGVSGLGVVIPEITVNDNSLTFANTTENQTSAAQSFDVSAVGLVANLVINCPSQYQISLSAGSGYVTTSLSLIPSMGSVSATPIYVRFAPTSTGLKTGNVSCTSTGATTKNVAVDGTGTASLLVGLVASYSLNGNANKNVGTNNGTATNVTWVTGQWSRQAGRFNGTSNILIADSSDFTFGSADFAVSLHIKKALNGTRQIFIGQLAAGASPSSCSFFIECEAANTIRVGLGISGNFKFITSSNTITDTNWHHIYLVRNSTVIDLYIDNVLRGTHTVAAAVIQDAVDAMAFGRGGNFEGLTFSGDIQEVNIYKKTVSSTERSSLAAGAFYPF